MHSFLEDAPFLFLKLPLLTNIGEARNIASPASCIHDLKCITLHLTNRWGKSIQTSRFLYWVGQFHLWKCQIKIKIICQNLSTWNNSWRSGWVIVMDHCKSTLANHWSPERYVFRSICPYCILDTLLVRHQNVPMMRCGFMCEFFPSQSCSASTQSCHNAWTLVPLWPDIYACFGLKGILDE